MPTDSVNLRAFCTAFKAMGTEPTDDMGSGKLYADILCNELHPDWKSAPKDVFIEWNEPSNDKPNQVVAPKHGKIAGRRVIESWGGFSYDKDFEQCSPLNNGKRELASYFIEAAFPNHVPHSASGAPRRMPDGKGGTPRNSERFSKENVRTFRDDLHPLIVEGLQKLYGICLETGNDDCLKSDTAKTVRDIWNGVQSNRKLLREKHDELIGQLNRFHNAALKLKDRSSLDREIERQMGNGLSGGLRTAEDYDRAIGDVKAIAAATEKALKDSPGEALQSNPGDGALSGIFSVFKTILNGLAAARDVRRTNRTCKEERKEIKYNFVNTW